VGDGATGTLLMAAGLPPGRPPEEATLTHPDAVADVARHYLEAGADLVETNTFGASPMKLALAGLASDFRRVNRDAVRLAREAVEGQRAAGVGRRDDTPAPWVVASCGPCGKLLHPLGEASRADVYDGFLAQVGILAEEGVDGIFIETMTDLDEALLAVRAAKEAAPNLPVAALMTFEATPRGFFTIMGNAPGDAVRALAGAGADAVGSNCGNGSEGMVALAREMARHTTLPLVIQPNAGLPRTVEGRLVYDEIPALMAGQARELVALGVALVGGCCGTTPEHVRALREMVDAVRRDAT
jgi:5-methyltetrahydrofolate--homocysteine methyltransferase